MSGTKICRDCHETKPLDQMQKDGEKRQTLCKQCAARRSAERRKKPCDTPIPTVKTCRDCGETKPAADMQLVRGRPQARCKLCANIRSKKWRDRNPDRVRAHSEIKKQRPGFIENKRAYMNRRYHAMSEDEKRDVALRSNYGIGIVDYNRMLNEQSGVCGICTNPAQKPESKYGVLVVDHCHDSGSVRGLLCGPCNLGLGAFRDDPSRLLSAAAYLLKKTNMLAAVEQQSPIM